MLRRARKLPEGLAAPPLNHHRIKQIRRAARAPKPCRSLLSKSSRNLAQPCAGNSSCRALEQSRARNVKKATRQWDRPAPAYGRQAQQAGNLRFAESGWDRQSCLSVNITGRKVSGTGNLRFAAPPAGRSAPSPWCSAACLRGPSAEGFGPQAEASSLLRGSRRGGRRPDLSTEFRRASRTFGSGCPCFHALRTLLGVAQYGDTFQALSSRAPRTLSFRA